MGPKLRSVIAKLAFAVLGVLISVPLAAWTDGLLLHQGVITPGMYVWRLLHPHSEPGFLSGVGSLLGTMMVIDSSCWFILFCLAGFTIVRAAKRKRVERIDTHPIK
jgi:hypothetical protein